MNIQIYIKERSCEFCVMKLLGSNLFGTFNLEIVKQQKPTWCDAG